ncbi:protein of unknown function [Xenorhabdus poinarii G6]|uniref:Uncharacterized protein n=1 Tax=Xenorhabdus poinarii G6 TaxID=1354304 RepID=A0A068R1S1_9GAMM|nr:protein of unknown function [Xenorhabdus poinarii G6]
MKLPIIETIIILNIKIIIVQIWLWKN